MPGSQPIKPHTTEVQTSASELLNAAEQIIASPRDYQPFFVEMAFAAVRIAKDLLAEQTCLQPMSREDTADGNEKA